MTKAEIQDICSELFRAACNIEFAAPDVAKRLHEIAIELAEDIGDTARVERHQTMIDNI